MCGLFGAAGRFAKFIKPQKLAQCKKTTIPPPPQWGWVVRRRPHPNGWLGVIIQWLSLNATRNPTEGWMITRVRTRWKSRKRPPRIYCSLPSVCSMVCIFGLVKLFGLLFIDSSRTIGRFHWIYNKLTNQRTNQLCLQMQWCEWIFGFICQLKMLYNIQWNTSITPWSMAERNSICRGIEIYLNGLYCSFYFD